MAKPNVLQLIDSFNQGGTERQAVQLTRMLHETGRYNVHVACLNNEGVLKPEIERLNLGPIHAFPTTSFCHPGIARQLATFMGTLRRLKIDLLHAHDFYTNVFGIPAARLARVSVRIASRRETDTGRTAAQRWVERRAFDCAHTVVVNANAIGRDLKKNGVPARKIYTVYNGIDLARLAPPVDASRSDTLGSLGLGVGGHRLFVTILANLRLAVKDHPTFLRAARRVKATLPGVGFIIAGEGPLLAPTRLLAAELGLAGDVFFTGRCARVAELLSVSDVCVLSSMSEGFPNAIVEYMAAGRPVVATDVGGAREAVTHGETGYLVPPGDDAAMASHLITLLQDPQRREDLGARGREAVRKFSCQAQLKRTLELYDRLLYQQMPRYSAFRSEPTTGTRTRSMMI